MYFVPLSQEESVKLLIHSLKAAAGLADCTMCPAYRVCMQQCLVIANSVEQMMQNGTLPQIGDVQGNDSFPAGQSDDKPDPPAGGPAGKGRLKVVK